MFYTILFVVVILRVIYKRLFEGVVTQYYEKKKKRKELLTKIVELKKRVHESSIPKMECELNSLIKNIKANKIEFEKIQKHRLANKPNELELYLAEKKIAKKLLQ